VADGPGASLAELLRRLRLSVGLTQEELAEAAGISTRSVSDLERGITRTTRKDTARLIADALGLSGSDREMFEATARGRIPGGDSGLQHDAGRLPIPPASLVGRADDVRTVCRLLGQPDVRLVTITGLGGSGRRAQRWISVHGWRPISPTGSSSST
jgi:transcriptional regulator with XRE-family HTH domain